MKKYMSVLRMKFINGMQYRVAALAGMATQFAWGGLLVLLYKAFYQSNPAQFTMTMQETSSYIWMQQAFLMMFMSWRADSSIYELITDGSVAYELIRPMSVFAVVRAQHGAKAVGYAAKVRAGADIRVVPARAVRHSSARLGHGADVPCVDAAGGQYRDCDYNAQLCNDILHNVGAWRANTVSDIVRRVYWQSDTAAVHAGRVSADS